MGGGSSYFDEDPKSVLRDLQETQQKTIDATYEAECNNLLSSYLVEYNNRDQEAVARHLGEIKGALSRELDGTVDLRYGGSVAKHTYVNGLSDIDSLVMLDNCELADHPPGEAQDYLVSRLRARFPRTEVSRGRLAVTIHFDDAEIQLLPAVSCRNHVKIADAQGTDWATIRPTEFTKALSKTNQATAMKVVPVVKLAKAIIGNLPEKHQISGYHAESLAVNIFRNYTDTLRTKNMLNHYFNEGSTQVMTPVTDRTGQSVHVDDYLGPSGSLKRQIISDAFARVARRMKNADITRRLEDWRNLFEE
jgi:hypothetical protein